VHCHHRLLSQGIGNALDFIDVSLALYKEESDRRTMINQLGALERLESPEVKLEVKTIRPNGTIAVTCPSSGEEAIIRIVEMKNEIGEGGSDPIVQAECGFVLICSSNKVTYFSIALTHAHSPSRSTNRSGAPPAVRCSSSESPVRISPFPVPSLQRNLSHNG